MRDGGLSGCAGVLAAAIVLALMLAALAMQRVGTL